MIRRSMKKRVPFPHPLPTRRIPIQTTNKEDTDDDNAFKLEGLLPDQYASIVEKMSYGDFKTFNFASKLSADMCKTRKEVDLEVDKVYICEMAESFKLNDEKAELCTLKNNVRLRTRIMEVGKISLDAILKHKITARHVHFLDDTASDTEFVKNVLELTRPTYGQFYEPDIKTLHLEQLEKMESIRIQPRPDFNDTHLLSIKHKQFYLCGNREYRHLTTNGVIEFLREWKEGKREIPRTLHLVVNRNFNAELILPEFNGHHQKPSLRMVLCRGDGISDLVLDASITGNAHFISAPCPGCGVPIRQESIQRAQSAFRGRSRSPPL